MAPRKTTTRKKRSTRGKSSGQSATAVMTVGAILVIGAAALWATSQNKTPSESVSGLFRNAMSNTASRTNPDNTKAPERKTAQAQSSAPQTSVTPVAPVRRPPLNVGQSNTGEQKTTPQQVAVLSPRIESKPAPQITPPKPAPQHAMPALPPVGKTAPDDNSRHASGAFKIPKAIIAKQSLVIREKAWDKAKTVGSVEKGREMRSYAKVGRWHRVVVPSTNIIGWVQEDQLIFKNKPRQANAFRAVSAPQAVMTTGSIRPVPEKQPAKAATAPAAKPHNTGLVAPVYPQQPVGK
ncbi:hypothetical protein P8H26_12520 [Pseudochrobactrum sp. sp1633]|uniref:hypothetical protein n=1 Tax=Pseudochrobactrum sp. sp1633 TaxID=3036706 RepID=UPI0025A67C86|nr:hypothetical protein [Pseudochrobactrum sp. sp1633]MDM8346214.1 hypothetical protein [Pseudochrobactrum sp. sp1633]HWD13719.1 hypothetical protein [Pseudochrobactrum sp.]